MFSMQRHINLLTWEKQLQKPLFTTLCFLVFSRQHSKPDRGTVTFNYIRYLNAGEILFLRQVRV